MMKKMFWFIPPSCGAERKTLIDVTLKFYWLESRVRYQWHCIIECFLGSTKCVFVVEFTTATTKIFLNHLTASRRQNLTLSCTYAWTDQSLGCCNINTLYLFQRWSLFCRCRCFFNKCLSFFIFFCLVTAPYTSPVARC
jgi:hypothetical protein